MAGKGPPPKDAAIRARTNKAATQAEVEGAPVFDPAAPHVPELPMRVCSDCRSTIAPPTPKRQKKVKGRKKKAAEKAEPICATCGGARFIPWHPLTIAWWADVWNLAANPFCVKYLPVHLHGLRDIARLREFWNMTGDIEYLKEIRLQEPNFGLTPRGQLGLQWSVKAPKAHAGPSAASTTPQGERPQRNDPRKVLFMESAGGERA